jgi:hypothetical protein
MCRGTDWLEERPAPPELLSDELLAPTRAQPGPFDRI